MQTTDLDAQSAVLWNMSEIAMVGGEAARVRFRDVLLASSSVPGVFPPVMFNVETDGATSQEMHVDGAVVSPFVLTPLIAIFWREEADPSFVQGNLYIILNGKLAAELKATPRNTVPIVARSFETSQLHQARASLAIVTEFARSRGLNFQFGFIPPEFDDSGSLEMKREELTALFDQAVSRAESGRLWWSMDELIRNKSLAPWIDRKSATGPEKQSDAAPSTTPDMEAVK